MQASGRWMQRNAQTNALSGKHRMLIFIAWIHDKYDFNILYYMQTVSSLKL